MKLCSPIDTSQLNTADLFFHQDLLYIKKRPKLTNQPTNHPIKLQTNQETIHKNKKPTTNKTTSKPTNQSIKQQETNQVIKGRVRTLSIWQMEEMIIKTLK